jgi:hypothetical protein
MLVKKTFLYLVLASIIVSIVLTIAVYIYINYYATTASIHITSQIKGLTIESTDKVAFSKYLNSLKLTKNNVITIPGINNTKIIKTFNVYITSVPQLYNQAFWPSQKDPFTSLGYTLSNNSTLNIYVYLHPSVFTRLKPVKIEKFINSELQTALLQLSVEFKETNKITKDTNKTYKQLINKYEKLIPNSGFVHIKYNDK